MSLKDESGETLGDSLALTVGSLKENIKIQQATILKSEPGVDIVGIAHPSSSTSLTGKYAALLALQNPNQNSEIAKQLCLHIIGKFRNWYIVTNSFLYFFELYYNVKWIKF